MRAWLTGSIEPGETFCRVLRIPDDEYTQAAVVGALMVLTDPANWEQHGTDTPDDAAREMLVMVLDFLDSRGDCMPVGGIISYGGSEAPPGWLMCDGGSYSSDDYPQLFAAIGTTFGAGGTVGDFNVPDMRGRSPLGAGDGAGLSPRVLGTLTGAETHQLTEAEMPAHSHSVHSHLATLPAMPGTDPAAGNEIPGTLTGTAGGNAAHYNVHPVCVVSAIIKT